MSTQDTLDDVAAEGEGSTNVFSRVPSYLVAADNHNVANGDMSLFEVLKDTTGVVAGAIAGQAAIPIPLIGAAIGGVIGGLTADSNGKILTAATISGITSFQNSATAIGNFFRSPEDQVEEKDTQEKISAYDDDLGAYYQEHKQAADLLGFTVGSLIPGTAALKALKVARGGALGSNLAKATGLLPSIQESALSSAISEITGSNATFSILNGNTIKALAAGFGEQALQGAIFETAVTATMFRSPILEDMDAGDFGRNILHGALFAGALGGGIEAVVSYGKIKAAKIASDIELRPFTHISELSEGATPAERIINYSDNKFNTPVADAALDAKFAGRSSRLRTDKITNLDSSIREAHHEIAKGDTILGNILTDATLTARNTAEIAEPLLGLKEASRLTERLAVESTIGKIAKKIGLGTASESELSTLSTNKVVYTKLWGEGAGIQSEAAPKFRTIQDTVLPGKAIEINTKGVKVGSSNFLPMTADAAKSKFNILTSSTHEAQARELWALHTPALEPAHLVGEYDTALLGKAYREYILPKIKLTDGSIFSPSSRAELLDTIEASKSSLRFQMLNQGVSTEEIAARLNTPISWVENPVSSQATREADLFANETHAATYNSRLDASGILRNKSKPYDILLKPQTVKMAYDTTVLKDLDGHVLEGMAVVKQKQVLYRDAAERVFSSFAGENAQYFPRVPEDLVYKADAFSGEQGALSFVNGGYRTAGSFFSDIGANTHNLITKNVNAVHATLEPILFEIRNDTKAALELSTLLNKVRNTPEKYVWDSEAHALVLRESGAGRVDATAEEYLHVENEVVGRYIAEHINLNGNRITQLKNFRALGGNQHLMDTETFYAPPVDPKLYPHVAFVTDPTISGTGHVKMIHAATERELDLLRSKVPAEFKVHLRGDSEQFHKAYGDYERELALHENYIDSAMHRSGVSAPFFPVTDPVKLTDDLMKWHIQKERQLVREGVSTLYSKEFAEFTRLSDTTTKLATSKFGSVSKYAEESVPTPYTNYMKLALDLSQSDKGGMYTTMNQMLDARVSNIWNKITGSFVGTKSVTELEEVNKAISEAGIKSAYYDAATDALANHVAPRGVLSSFIQKANSILVATVLHPDILNAVNNTIGATILGGTEFASVAAAIQRGDAGAVGELAALAHIKVPGTSESVVSPTKLMSGAMKNWFNPQLREQAFKAGFTTRHSADWHAINDELTLTGTESVSQLDSRILSAYNKAMQWSEVAQKYSGNKLAEEFTRFISADIMRQLTDIAVTHGVMDKTLASSYIRTFVNRTQGNYLASQRPLAFQGPIGQAVGLFQTYQFNLMQQLFRHVADGRGKTAAMLLGLQGTIYGMNGMPAFQAVNTHLIGNASGNTNNADIYSATYGALGKDAADWLMYGTASNMFGIFHPDLKINLYTRGDINPRTATVLPVNPLEIPIVKASTKFFSGALETVAKLGQGGAPATTILQGIEHSSVNRPLAGLAQTLEAFTNPNFQSFSTTNSGNISATNDFLSLANFGRLLGGKPLTEAIAQDAGFRYSVYQAKDSEVRKALGESIKTTVVAGGIPSEEQMQGFIHSYVASGGKQKNFIKYFMGVKASANTSQANVIASNLKTPYAQSMQQLMGGAAIKDFTNTPINQTDIGE